MAAHGGVKHLYQVIFCSSRAGRCFRREITLTDRAAMVTAVETMPPGYHAVLARMRRENEAVESVVARLQYRQGCASCPFCDARAVFYCGCGALSCIGIDVKVHSCPVCRDVAETRDGATMRASASGFIHGRTIGEKPKLSPEWYGGKPEKPPPGSWTQRLLGESGEPEEGAGRKMPDMDRLLKSLQAKRALKGKK